MRLKTLLVGGVTLVWMLLAQPALGATAGVLTDAEGNVRLVYEAAVGEINYVTVFETPEGVFMIDDLGATITPLTAECTSISPSSVRCDVLFPHAFVGRNVDVFTLDGADNVRAGSAYAIVHGGDGADTLTGTRKGQRLFGGPGDDRLVGGSGIHQLYGGEGADSLDGGSGSDVLEGGAGTDVLAGGSGRDTVSYVDHTGPVRISLDGRANDGAAGEGDWVQAGIESAVGSRGPTAFIGNGSRNSFFGAGERDVVRAGGGDDGVFGAGGADVLSGGAGADYLYGESGADLLLGGPGNDGLFGEGGADDLRGGSGDDRRLSGGRGKDILRGGHGWDHLFGDEGADLLYARDRNRDQVDGGAGPDRAQVDPIDRLFLVELLF
jgi:Ca2+-binding RTX toxin-like protein